MVFYVLQLAKVNNAGDRAVRDAKIDPLRLYDLRHTWATRAAMSGIDLVTLAAMLGHSRIQMVLRYAHPTQAHQAKAMEQLEQFNAAQQIAAFEKQQPQSRNENRGGVIAISDAPHGSRG